MTVKYENYQIFSLKISASSLNFIQLMQILKITMRFCDFDNTPRNVK